MRAVFWDYFWRLAKNTVSLMSGLASLILTVAGWFVPSYAAQRWFWGSAIVCLLGASVGVWYSERKERIRLEREGGPNVFIRILGSGGSLVEQIEFKNEAQEGAADIRLQEIEGAPVKFWFVPWVIPFLGASNSATRELVVSKGDVVRSLSDFLEGEQSIRIAVLFKNTSLETTFCRSFRLSRPLLTNEVQCHPESRTITAHYKADLLRH